MPSSSQRTGLKVNIIFKWMLIKLGYINTFAQTPILIQILALKLLSPEIPQSLASIEQLYAMLVDGNSTRIFPAVQVKHYSWHYLRHHLGYVILANKHRYHLSSDTYQPAVATTCSFRTGNLNLGDFDKHFY